MSSKAEDFPKLCFPAGSELPSTTGMETAELGDEMKILSFFCANPQNGLSLQGRGSHSPELSLILVSHPFSNHFGTAGDSSALFSSLEPFLCLSFSL